MENEKYNFSEIEKKWQEKWEREGIYKVDLDKAKKPFYNLMMFPYPSAEGLHVGNMYAFTHSDAYGRFMRLKGYDVFEPIGLDGFGIHSENYAIKIGEHIKDVSARTEKHFYQQLHMIGNAYDWDKKVETYKPEYYKWTQWLFLKMYEKGLAYKKGALVNWCPKCKTVLSDEQVVGGRCERCDSVAEKKEMDQWFFKITDYAEKLLNNLDWIDWAEEVKTIQRNWIGRSEGVEIQFFIRDENRTPSNSPSWRGRIKEEALPIRKGEKKEDDAIIKVFTTRVDTIFGCAYIVVSPENEIISKIKNQLENFDEVGKYIEKVKNKSDLERTDLNKEKTGVELKGVKAVNPFNGEEVPIFVADYVLGGYGTGAVMAVPAHDERDYEFAKKYNLPIKNVIEPITGDARNNEEFNKRIVAIVKNPKTDKLLSINWGNNLGGNLFIGGGIEERENAIECAKREIEEETGYKNFKLISQSEKIHHHYFAASKNINRNIEVVGFYFELEDEENGGQNLHEIEEKGKFKVEWISINEAEEKVKDSMHKYLFDKFIKEKIWTGDGILADSGDFSGLTSEEAREKMADWLKEKKIGGKKINYKLRDWCVSRQRYWGPPIPMIYCKKCGWVPVPEKDLPVELPEMDDFLPDGSGKGPLNKVESFVNTICPVCGGKAKRETDVSDPFVDSCWYFMRYLCADFSDKPLDKNRLKKWMPVNMYIGGKEHSVLHLLYSRFITMAMCELGYSPKEEPFEKFRAHGLLIKDGVKMSKSKGNVINPDEYIEDYGADTVRMYLMFLGDMRQGGDWRDDGVNGMHKFLKRIFIVINKAIKELKKVENDSKIIDMAIKKCTDNLDNLKFNTTISQLMICFDDRDFIPKLNNKDEFEGDVYNKKAIEKFLILLAPFAPHLAEELWEKLGNSESIFKQKWPEYNPELIKEEIINIPIQINGKVRDIIEVDADAVEEKIKNAAISSEKIKKWLDGKEAKKIIYIKGKMVSIVV
ncbi:MAG: class I tRNA ligase family protein [bacterium]